MFEDQLKKLDEFRYSKEKLKEEHRSSRSAKSSKKSQHSPQSLNEKTDWFESGDKPKN